MFRGCIVLQMAAVCVWPAEESGPGGYQLECDFTQSTLRRQAALSAAFSVAAVLCRQTNVMWAAFIAGVCIPLAPPTMCMSQNHTILATWNFFCSVE